MKFRRCESDFRFMCVVWDNETLSSGELVKLCNERLGWKKSTTYTTLKKLCEKGFAQNVNTIVSSLVEKEKVQPYASNHFMRDVMNQIIGSEIIESDHNSFD